MFRLVKVIGGNTQYDVVKLTYASSSPLGCGCALSCSNGNTTNASATVMPEYISLTNSENLVNRKIDAMIITEDMVFKVEFSGTGTPSVGMPVGLATEKFKMDSVSYNASGKGEIIALEDDKKYVYVKFRK